MKRLPDLPGMARGIVGRTGTRYTLQCERCFELETPQILVLMQTHFHARPQGEDNPRLCTACRIATYPDCNCDYCQEDREK